MVAAVAAAIRPTVCADVEDVRVAGMDGDRLDLGVLPAGRCQDAPRRHRQLCGRCHRCPSLRVRRLTYTLEVPFTIGLLSLTACGWGASLARPRPARFRRRLGRIAGRVAALTASGCSRGIRDAVRRQLPGGRLGRPDSVAGLRADHGRRRDGLRLALDAPAEHAARQPAERAAASLPRPVSRADGAVLLPGRPDAAGRGSAPRC